MPDTSQLVARLATVVGAGQVSTDPAACVEATADLFPVPTPARAELVVRPGSTDEVARVVNMLAAEGRAMVPRGAGLSYTSGVSPVAPAVVIDTAQLDSIEVHADDLYAIVGAGCSWQKLAEALAPHGLRAAQINPISGVASTVGGLASQSVPGGTDGVLGLEVVLADGTVARTGSFARNQSPFLRNFGPDLTGLFLGDCGAFGVKTRVVLRLVPDRPCAFASFAYADPRAMLEDMVTLLRRGLVTRAMAIDPQKGAEATRVEAGEAAKMLGATLARAGSFTQAVKDVAQLARGASELKHAGWSMHLTVEGPDASVAEAQMALARSVCAAHGREIENIVPKMLRAKPYSLRGFVGLAGERWVPVHGMLPYTRALACFDALEAALASETQAMTAARISRSFLVSSAGAGFVTIEPMFFWPDALDPIHLAHLSPRNRDRFGGRPANPAARAEVARLRMVIRDVMDRHEAVHVQVGRFYRYTEIMTPGSSALVSQVKRALDPDGRMNPGALGLA